MPRPTCCRRVSGEPVCAVFKPTGAVGRRLEQVAITLDEFEAVRLADLEGLYQEQGAERMGVSRPTFGRILTSAHRKIAEALVGGKVLRIEGGRVECELPVRPRCDSCQLEWDNATTLGESRPRCQCPHRSQKLASARADARVCDAQSAILPHTHREETET